MDDLSDIDIASLTREERLELREKFQSRLNELNAPPKPQLTEEKAEQYTHYLKSGLDRPEKEEINEDRIAQYASHLQTENPINEIALMGGEEPVTASQMSALWSRVQMSLASLGGGGYGEGDVVNAVTNNFGLAPLDSDEILRDVKVRFRLAATPTVLNSSEVSSITTTGSGDTRRYTVNFSTPFASADDYITMLTLDQEGTDRNTTIIPPVNASSRVPIVIQQNAGSVTVAVENAESAANQEEGVLNVKIFDF